jgi:hypothetical protein
MVASPVKVTVVEALDASAKLALAAGLADQLENTKPVAGVATMLVATPGATLVAAAGVMPPFASVPGVSM